MFSSYLQKWRFYFFPPSVFEVVELLVCGEGVLLDWLEEPVPVCDEGVLLGLVEEPVPVCDEGVLLD
jgi:hypothetical protein